VNFSNDYLCFVGNDLDNVDEIRPVDKFPGKDETASNKIINQIIIDINTILKMEFLIICKKKRIFNYNFASGRDSGIFERNAINI